ncbi:MAG: 3-hydroxyacyl-CoA dehydrogenase [Pseudomonadota bacterium]
MKLDSSIAAIITGGASGLGEATARELASAGVKVALFDLNEERGEAVAKELGGVFAKVDVGDEDSVKAGLDKAREANGAARILINCAGIGWASRTVDKNGAHNLEVFNKVVQVNLIGTFNCLRLAAAEMVDLDPMDDNERGAIVNTASVAAFDGQIGQAAYSASKGGVVGMTLPIARDMSRHGVRVCTIAPGLFETPMMMGLPDAARASLGASVPFPPRLGKPHEFASMARQICENTMLNGETIRLDGAIRMAPK